MPRLGLGAYQNYDAKASVLEAFRVGYRWGPVNPNCISLLLLIDFLNIGRHVDSAQAYRNEAHVAEAVRESGIPRKDLFISA